MKEEHQDDVLVLIIRNLSSIADSDETGRLNEWLGRSPINRQYFESFVTLYHNKDSQKVGTAMTYARRYLYESILMMRGTPDDDAESNHQAHKEEKI